MTQDLIFTPKGIEHFAGDQLPKEMLLAIRFVKLLESNFREEHLQEFYAKQLNLSVFRLNGLLKAYYGKTSYEMIQHRLHEEALKLLRYTNMTVREITFDLGICDPSWFAKCFKRIEGCGPKEYRCKNAG